MYLYFNNEKKSQSDDTRQKPSTLSE